MKLLPDGAFLFYQHTVMVNYVIEKHFEQHIDTTRAENNFAVCVQTNKR